MVHNMLYATTIDGWLIDNFPKFVPHLILSQAPYSTINMTKNVWIIHFWHSD